MYFPKRLSSLSSIRTHVHRKIYAQHVSSFRGISRGYASLSTTSMNYRLNSHVEMDCKFSVQCRKQSSLSSISEPFPTLFTIGRLEPTESNLDKKLRSDIKTMGAILGKIIKEHSGMEVFDKVETLRTFAKVS